MSDPIKNTSQETKYINKYRKIAIKRNYSFWKNVTFTKFGTEEFYKQCQIITKILCKNLITADMAIYDVGCGNGENTKIISQYCKYIIGYDISNNILDIARDQHPLTNGRYEELDLVADTICFPNGVDGVFCTGVLSIIPEPDKVAHIIAQIKKALKPGGFLVTRETFSLGKTICTIFDTGYYATYRSTEDYLRLFTEAGFTHQSQVNVSRSGGYSSDYHIFFS